MQPHHHRTFVVGRYSGGPYIEVQTVFAHRGSEGIPFGCIFRRTLGRTLWCTPATTGGSLHAHRPEFIGLASSFPICWSLGSTPGEIADRRRGEGNAFVNANVRAIAGGAGDHSGIKLYRIVNSSEGSRRNQDEQVWMPHGNSRGQSYYCEKHRLKACATLNEI